MDYPKVNPEICTGCGICVDSFPMEAITLVNDVAFIDTTKCSNCRACVDDCPNEAIN
ncbi:MAG: 4Fe-4S binding protein [Bacteroidales bacterium]|nr:4Fe-4S binding protein [Bacteroidales bacterium]